MTSRDRNPTHNPISLQQKGNEMTHSATAAFRGQLRRIESEYPGWHLWASTSGHIYATGCNIAAARYGAQVTLDAGTPAGIGAAIERWTTEALPMAEAAERIAGYQCAARDAA